MEISRASLTQMCLSSVYTGDASHTRRKEGTMDVMLAIIAAKGACGSGVSLILWIIAAVLVISGIVTLIRGAVLAGIAMIVIGLLIGPGGVSIFC
jgi:hypothetical protein